MDYNSIKQNYKDQDDFIELLQNSIWPNTDSDTFLALLDEGGKECLEMRYGQRQETCLHRATRFGKTKVVNILLERGSSVSVTNSFGSTPLHLACEYGYHEIVKILIAKGAPLMEKDNGGDGPMHWSAKRGDMSIMCTMKSAGACPKLKGRRGNNMLHCAASKGCLELVDWLLDNIFKETPSVKNDLGETPLHLAAAYFTKENNCNQDVVQRILEAGADLNARTEWGDTPAHYAAQYSCYEVLRQLIDQGAEVHKPIEFKKSYANLFERHSIQEEEAEVWQYTILQKAAKSTCIVKNTYLLGKVMDAKKKECINLYFNNNANNSHEVELQDMSDQEEEFAKMGKEISNYKCNISTFRMYLQYCPDAVTYLLNRCLNNECDEQVQGKIFLDFFLFNPHCPLRCSSELEMVKILFESGKEKFLIHPIVEVFMKIKWKKTWFLYWMYLFVFAVFFFALTAYSLVHYGSLQKGYSFGYGGQRSGWWYLLATTHAINCIMLPFQLLKYLVMYRQCQERSRNTQDDPHARRNHVFIARMICQFTMKYVLNPILVGFILYGREILGGGDNYFGVRVCIAFSLINTSYLFLGSIGTHPFIGTYTNMISKVFTTVTSFFLIYFWHLTSYAIAFHILLPNTGPFQGFDNSLIKVFTMLLGEYNYAANFVKPDESGFWAKVFFVAFMLDMSVVLMNLVLGMAVSDIDALQKSSAIKRMANETLIVDNMEGFFLFVGKLMPFMDRFGFSRVTSDKTAEMKDITYIKIVDFDRSAANKIVMEYSRPEENGKPFECPHHIIVGVIKVVGEFIRQARFREDPAALQKPIDTKKLLEEYHEKLMKELTNIRQEIKAIKPEV